MNAVGNVFSSSAEGGFGSAKVKLFWLAQVLRVLSSAYAAWMLLRIVQWWTDAERVIFNMGKFVGRDLSDLAASARMLALALDAGAWLFLLAAVVCCWRSLTYLLKEHTFSLPIARLLTWAGWLGALCQSISLLIRPVQTYLMTAHLPAAEQVFKWSMYPQDLLGILLCGVILCFAYLIRWALEIAEENRGFV